MAQAETTRAPDAPSNRKLLRTGGGTFVVRIAALLATFVGSIVLARGLGPSGFGVYSYAFAIVTLLAVPVQLGVPTLIVRETARGKTEGNWARVRGIWWWAGSRVMIASVLIVTAGLSVVLLLRDSISPDQFWTLVFAFALIPLIALGRVRGAALRGLGHIVKGQLPEEVLRPVFLMTLVAIPVWLLAEDLTPYRAMAFHAVAAGLAFIIGFVLLIKARPADMLRETRRETDSPAWMAALWPLTLIAGLEVITQQTDVLMIGFWKPAEDVGYYKIAMSAAALTGFGLRVVSLTVGPQVVRHCTNKNTTELAHLAKWSAGFGLLFTVPVVIIFGFWGSDILTLVYGAAFANAYAPLLILVVSQVVNSFFGICLLLLNMSGHERDSLRGVMMSTGANVVLNAILIPMYGIVGAAMATLLSVAFLNLIVWRLVRLRLGIDSSALSLLKSGKAA